MYYFALTAAIALHDSALEKRDQRRLRLQEGSHPSSSVREAQRLRHARLEDGTATNADRPVRPNPRRPLEGGLRPALGTGWVGHFRMSDVTAALEPVQAALGLGQEVVPTGLELVQAALGLG